MDTLHSLGRYAVEARGSVAGPELTYKFSTQCVMMIIMTASYTWRAIFVMKRLEKCHNLNNFFKIISVEWSTSIIGTIRLLMALLCCSCFDEKELDSF